ncbi:TetR-like C-terminal domain-containing protein, partial [Streptococcus suis]
RGFALLRERLMEADVAEPPREALVAQGLAYIAFARSRPALFRLLFAGPAEATIDTACKASGYTVLSRRVAGIATHAPEAAALACWGLVHGLATLELDGREMADTP